LSDHDKAFATVFVAVLGALAVLAIILYFIAGALTKEMSAYKSEEVILENIKPVGEVNVAGEPTAEEPVAAAPAPAEPATAAPVVASVQEIYQSKCFACHGTGAAGAPKPGDAAAWAPRIAQGMDTLLANAISGLKAMPPKGLCMSCSEDDLKRVIEYMVAQSQ